MTRFKKPRRRRRLLMAPGGAERLGKGGICPKEASGKSTEPAGLGLNNQQPTRRPRGQNSYSDGGGGSGGPAAKCGERSASHASAPGPRGLPWPPRPGPRAESRPLGASAAGRPRLPGPVTSRKDEGHVARTGVPRAAAPLRVCRRRVRDTRHPAGLRRAAAGRARGAPRPGPAPRSLRRPPHPRPAAPGTRSSASLPRP
ncbi:transcription initiation factor TFIID subunit 4-like isoform X2 [Myotis myotis]|uniref:transcription initiation factor TFIID subunit 4-like isoform X2 n=1 Tax=Myotis myotis TaxID=51298 RepID=UPI00174C2BC0|nr:transcription initiation factor TFIID subunit 4-like isoform X2 [Myotis myotis]